MTKLSKDCKNQKFRRANLQESDNDDPLLHVLLEADGGVLRRFAHCLKVEK